MALDLDCDFFTFFAQFYDLNRRLEGTRKDLEPGFLLGKSRKHSVASPEISTHNNTLVQATKHAGETAPITTTLLYEASMK